MARRDDCIFSIAKKFGFSADTIWNHSRNADLKERRQNANVLQQGDVVFIPDRVRKEVSCVTEQRYRFRRKGIPIRLTLIIVRDTTTEKDETSDQQSPTLVSNESEDPTATGYEPQANSAFILNIDGKWTEGETDNDGKIEVFVPPDAQHGRLILNPGTLQEVSMPLALGHLDPSDTEQGIKQRLTNLGFDCGETDVFDDRKFQVALRAFQQRHGLPMTGEPDNETRDRLLELHGS